MKIFIHLLIHSLIHWGDRVYYKNSRLDTVLCLQSLYGVASARRPPTMSDDVIKTTLPWWRRFRLTCTSCDYLQPISVLHRQRRQLLWRHSDVRLRSDKKASTSYQVGRHVPKVSICADWGDWFASKSQHHWQQIVTDCMSDEDPAVTRSTYLIVLPLSTFPRSRTGDQQRIRNSFTCLLWIRTQGTRTVKSNIKREKN